MTEESKLILITDVIETRVRKEKEIAYYQEQLKKIQQKMFGVHQKL